MIEHLGLFKRLALVIAFSWIGLCVSCADVTNQKSSLADIKQQNREDEDGVKMLFPAAPGPKFRLGTQNPNSASNFRIERKTTASSHVESGNHYWRIWAHSLRYASGGFGRTSRLHIYASGGRHRKTAQWKLFAEYIDMEGVSTGRYTKRVDWSGWQTTLRTDGVDRLDFALLSLREIVPPSS